MAAIAAAKSPTIRTSPRVDYFAPLKVEAFRGFDLGQLHFKREIIDKLALATNKVRMLGLGWQFVAPRLTGEFDANNIKPSRHFADGSVDRGGAETAYQFTAFAEYLHTS